ncbi:helix-turn-helix domain-containing protein [Streptomyces niveus]|uniref:helix-turn-helix domain-containing protein n=1 Tax=Streptomyces niveus TaxID=193462 RepID=UPI0033C70CCC
MDVQHLSAPSRATSGVPRPVARSGVVHANTRHTKRYTVVGNHLAQHRELTLVAIGLAVHIQSLPAGARIGIKCLTARFPESEARIAAALRELEAAGYLERTRERLPSGRIVTHTVSYNQPPQAVRRPEPVRLPAPEPVPAPAPTPDKPPPPPLPQPLSPDPDRHRVAADLLAGLRGHDPRLLLAERDVRRLAPGVATWLERGAAPDSVRRALTANLPEAPRHPAALLAHRLTALLPPPLPPTPTVVRPHPFQTCDRCERAFRAPEPGRCRDCGPAGRDAVGRGDSGREVPAVQAQFMLDPASGQNCQPLKKTHRRVR